ncbi:tubulin folding cofactor C like protein [Babesia gibsoni]|uniref:Tubulin folding cofactor C like protein n=1 Tax=Babesia gibsoni TaxID=33632 RepID=A0AAD8PCA0_BABGI|nr:tubulin folding cofactor C like protein [Babesia gibsoni]
MSEASSIPTLADAEALYEQCKKCETHAEVKILIKTVNDSIKAYLSVSSAEAINPAIYKTLRNAARHVDNLDRELAPKLGFSFKVLKRNYTSDTTGTTADATVAGVSQDAKNKVEEPKGGPPCTVTLSHGTMTICGLEGLDVVRRCDELNDVGIVNVKQLGRCRVLLLGTVDSVYIADVKDCIIWIGISKAAVILDSIVNSTVILCCSQLRIANSQNNTFLVDTVTLPIIEKSSHITFAKNHVLYSEFRQQLEESRLEIKGLTRHSKIKDFSWHRDEPSPNWKIITPLPCISIAPEVSVETKDITGNKYTLSEENWAILDALKQNLA